MREHAVTPLAVSTVNAPRAAHSHWMAEPVRVRYTGYDLITSDKHVIKGSHGRMIYQQNLSYP